MNIYICSNLSEWLNKFDQIVRDVVRENKIPINAVYSTTAVEDILSQLPHAPASSLYFLDEELKSGIDGVSLIQKIGEHDHSAYMILVTPQDNLIDLSSYSHHKPMNDIMKDNLNITTRERILKCLENAMMQHIGQTNVDYLQLKIKNTTISIKPSSIYCIDTGTSRKIIIYTKTTRQSFNYSLGKIKKKLDASFYPCSRTCIINLYHVSHVDKQKHQVFLENGMSRTVSGFRMNQVYKQWLKCKPPH